MKHAFLVILLILPISIVGQHTHNNNNAEIKSSDIFIAKGLGRVHHSVSTKNVLAQQFFDQGLAYVYAFNHQEAIRSFRRASELDPDLAMAYWGIALALGSNYNLEADSLQ